MLVKYVDTIAYSCIMVLICLGVILLFGVLALWGIALRHIKKEENKYDKEKIARIKKKCWSILAVDMVLLSVFVYLIVIYVKYHNNEKTVWKSERSNNENALCFEIIERNELQDIKQNRDKLHIEWYSLEAQESIDKETLDYYKKNVNDIFIAVPQKENRIDYAAVGKINSNYKKKHEHFIELVRSNHKNLDPEELWKGYQDGLTVCEIYETSENIFQTAVLAESACENAQKFGVQDEVLLEYTAGMISQFERFLDFRNRDIGNGIQVSDVDVCFRMEKGLYRVSMKKSLSDDEVVKHCSLFAYACSQYVVEETDISDSRYLMYLNYSGLSCLNIVKYINDTQLCKELCQKELDRWKQLEEIEIGSYEREGKELDAIMETKKCLEEYVYRMKK